MVLAIRERLTWCDDDTLARMDAQRVEVLHVAYGDAVVETVAHHLIFYLLPALQRFLHQHLRRERERFFGLCQQLLVVVAEAAAETAEGVGGTQYNRKAQLVCRPLHFLDRRARNALDGLHANLVEPFHKQVAVFRIDDGLHGRTQHLDTVFRQHTLLIEFYAAVQGCLSTERQENTIGTLFLDDALHELRRHRLEIHRVRHIL